MAGRASNELRNRRKQEFDASFESRIKLEEANKKRDEGRADNIARIAAKRELLKSRKNNKEPETILHHKEPETIIHHKEPEKKKKSRPSLLEALTEAHKDNFISKSMVEKYKKDIDEGDTKALKSRLKHLDYPFEEDDEPIEKYVSDEKQYIPPPPPKKTRAKQIPVKDIGSELHKRTHKAKLSPETKKEIMSYVMLF